MISRFFELVLFGLFPYLAVTMVVPDMPAPDDTAIVHEGVEQDPRISTAEEIRDDHQA